jgi:hypothetical protein
LIALGLPAGKKSSNITLPHVLFCKPDYFRGLVDADGSVGMTAGGLPFVSLTTNSDHICEGFRNYIHEVTGQRKSASRGSRDGIYNILVMREHTQLLIEQMYYPGSLALPCKQEKAQQILSWRRPDILPKAPPHKPWVEEEDAFILSHTIGEAIAILQRSKQSIKMRLYRLKPKQFSTFQNS